MPDLVHFANVGAHIRKQGYLTDEQHAAFVAFGEAQEAGATLTEAVLAFTQKWRSSPPATPPKKEQQQQEWGALVKLSELEQPNAYTCQSAMVAALLGQSASQIKPIRQALDAAGDPGDPLVIADYLEKRLGPRYEYHGAATLGQVIAWLKAGCAIGTHGWQTESGHCFWLTGLKANNATGRYEFEYWDPWGKFDPKTWKYLDGYRHSSGWMTDVELFAIAVRVGGVSASRHAYRNGDAPLDEAGMWAHVVFPESPKNPSLSNPVATKPRQVNQAGVDLIKTFEGLKLRSYLCPAGVWTIGWGTTIIDGYPVTKNRVITESQAVALLRKDLDEFGNRVTALVKVPLTDNQFAALVSFAYNLGAGALKESTLLRKLNAGDYLGAKAEFGRWVKADGKTLQGLVRRRQAEAELFGRKP